MRYKNNYNSSRNDRRTRRNQRRFQSNRYSQRYSSRDYNEQSEASLFRRLIKGDYYNGYDNYDGYDHSGRYGGYADGRVYGNARMQNQYQSSSAMNDPRQLYAGYEEKPTLFSRILTKMTSNHRTSLKHATPTICNNCVYEDVEKETDYVRIDNGELSKPRNMC